MSRIEWTIRKRGDGGWTDVPLEDVVGESLEAVLNSYAGQEVVAEFVMDGKKHYFCGTGELKERMRAKGHSITFAEGIELMRSACPEFAVFTCPLGEEVQDVFGPGSVIEKIVSDDPLVAQA